MNDDNVKIGDVKHRARLPDIKTGIPTVFNTRFSPIIDFRDKIHDSPVTKEDWDRREVYLKGLSKILESCYRADYKEWNSIFK